ncbi:MAG: hypothetical protein ACE5JD_01060, partial [Candidatus Methylomirabilia bacterium]
FLEESVRTLVETQVLVGERGAYHLAKAVGTIQVPATVQAVLAARIDRLPAEDKRLLQSASVIGETVPFALLQAVVETPEEELRRGLSRLQTVEFLYETSLFPDLEYTFKHGLTHQVAYNSLLQERRRALHARIVQGIERLYPHRLAEQVERLAHHALRGEVWEKALLYLGQAGQRAIQRSAHVEALSHLRSGLEVLKALPESAQRAQQELALQSALGPVLIATKGYGASEVEHAYARALELSREVGETPQLFPAVRGLWNWYLLRAELQAARELGDQLLTLAERTQDPALLVEAHRALGTTLFWLGDFSLARAHLEQGIGLYDPRQHRSLAFLYGATPGVICRVYAAWVLSWLGYPDQALQWVHEALALARELPHPFSLAWALSWAAMVHRLRREAPAAQRQAEAAIALSSEHGFPQWLAMGMIERGSALAAQGRAEDGIAQISQGLVDWKATGAELSGPWFLLTFAEAYGHGGQAEEGLRTLAEGLALIEQRGERATEAEVYRLKGDLLLMQGGRAAHQAEACFRQAIDVAREQRAKFLELRAARSLSRLWQTQGKRGEARQMLAEIYGWFTEGFGTADLREAKALLAELRD